MRLQPLIPKKIAAKNRASPLEKTGIFLVITLCIAPSGHYGDSRPGNERERPFFSLLFWERRKFSGYPALRFVTVRSGTLTNGYWDLKTKTSNQDLKSSS